MTIIRRTNISIVSTITTSSLLLLSCCFCNCYHSTYGFSPSFTSIHHSHSSPSPSSSYSSSYTSTPRIRINTSYRSSIIHNNSCIKYFQKRMYFPLYSSLFYHDDDDNDDVNDDDINWDEEDEDEDDTNTNFNIQYQGRSILLEDDTDESYYENLFRQQAGNINNDDGDDDNEDKTFQIQNENQSTKSELSSLTKSIKYSTKNNNSNNNYNNYNNKQIQRNTIQNQSKYKRKQKRKDVIQGRIEERAMFLALRLLRRQSTTFLQSSTSYNNSSSSYSNTTTSSIQYDDNHQYNDNNNNNILINTINTIPLPTISISSTIQYKTKEDNVNHDIITIEKKLYGNRYKVTYNVYLRLLETLHQIKNESKIKAREYIVDGIEGSILYDDDNVKNTMQELNLDRIQQSIEMNSYQKERMKNIIQLSLFRIKQQAYNNSSSNNKQDKSTLSKESIFNKVNDIYDLDSMSLEDLSSILRIRGNVNRRGRLPKTRKKIMEQLALSFSTNLFQ